MQCEKQRGIFISDHIYISITMATHAAKQHKGKQEVISAERHNFEYILPLFGGNIKLITGSFTLENEKHRYSNAYRSPL